MSSTTSSGSTQGPSGPSLGTFTYFPLARRGAAAAIPDTSADNLTGALDWLRVSPSLGLQVNTTGVDGSSGSFTAGPGNLITQSTPAATGLQLYGPGDVIGFDTRHVVRTEPADGTANFDFDSPGSGTGGSTLYYLPAIEFDDPDLPWMFTPAQAFPDANNVTHARLHPWLALIVLADGEYSSTPPGQAGGLATIAINQNGVGQLHDLGGSWQWAHAQLTGVLNGGSLDDVFQNSPERLVSRLFCPRLLSAGTHYTAFLVPAYDAGAQAGVAAASSNASGLNPAWTASTTSLTLPVYYSFSFTTGAAGDFKSLALRLVPQALGSVGQRSMATNDPRNQTLWALPPITTDGQTLELGGALSSPDGFPDTWLTGTTSTTGTSGTGATNFQEQLATVLNLAGQPVGDNPSNPDPTVVPPIYGRYHAQVSSVQASAEAWVDVLNLDPRLRAAAGLGAQVVTSERSQLMASAWAQIRGVELANQILRQAQLNRAALQQPYQATFQTVSSTSLLILAANVQRRLVVNGATPWSTIASGPVPWRIFTAGIRRLTRPRGPWRRRQGQMGRSLDAMVTALGSGALSVIPTGFPNGTGPDVLGDALRPPALKDFPVAEPTDYYFTTTDAAVPGTGRENDSQDLYTCITGLAKIFGDLPVPTAARPTITLETLASDLVAGLDPAKTVVARANSLVTAADWSPTDPIEPIMAAPNFPSPMYAPLRDLSQELLLPGVGDIPPDCIGLLSPDRRFLESYMVGLNFEMARQLLWNGYPTDQRGSYFRQFWQPVSTLQPATAAGPASSGSPSLSPNDATYDIAPIHTWTSALGQNLNADNTQQPGLVLVVRGELLRRYPTTAVYAAPAIVTQQPAGDPATEAGTTTISVSSDPTTELQPLFRGTLPPDLTYLAFPFTLTRVEALTGGNDSGGYFFVLQQHPTEPRFALSSPQAPSGCDNSASIAQAAYQSPVRVAIHARLMLPPPSVAGIGTTSGPAAGGTAVIVTGSGLGAATTVYFGTAAGTDLSVGSDTELSVVSPPGAAGSTVDVTVADPTGTSPTVSADQFTYGP